MLGRIFDGIKKAAPMIATAAAIYYTGGAAAGAVGAGAAAGSSAGWGATFMKYYKTLGPIINSAFASSEAPTGEKYAAGVNAGTNTMNNIKAIDNAAAASRHYLRGLEIQKKYDESTTNEQSGPGVPRGTASDTPADGSGGSPTGSGGASDATASGSTTQDGAEASENNPDAKSDLDAITQEFAKSEGDFEREYGISTKGDGPKESFSGNRLVNPDDAYFDEEGRGATVADTELSDRYKVTTGELASQGIDALERGALRHGNRKIHDILGEETDLYEGMDYVAEKAARLKDWWDKEPSANRDWYNSGVTSPSFAEGGLVRSYESGGPVQGGAIPYHNATAAPQMREAIRMPDAAPELSRVSTPEQLEPRLQPSVSALNQMSHLGREAATTLFSEQNGVSPHLVLTSDLWEGPAQLAKPVRRPPPPAPKPVNIRSYERGGIVA